MREPVAPLDRGEANSLTNRGIKLCANLFLCNQSQQLPATEMQTNQSQATARLLPEPELMKNGGRAAQGEMHTQLRPPNVCRSRVGQGPSSTPRPNIPLISSWIFTLKKNVWPRDTARCLSQTPSLPPKRAFPLSATAEQLQSMFYQYALDF